jgi:hypothetical protein
MQNVFHFLSTLTIIQYNMMLSSKLNSAWEREIFVNCLINLHQKLLLTWIYHIQCCVVVHIFLNIQYPELMLMLFRFRESTQSSIHKMKIKSNLTSIIICSSCEGSIQIYCKYMKLYALSSVWNGKRVESSN